MVLVTSEENFPALSQEALTCGIPSPSLGGFRFIVCCSPFIRLAVGKNLIVNIIGLVRVTGKAAMGRGCVKRALILMSMGQRATLTMNRKRRRLLVPILVTCQWKCRSYLLPPLVILRFDTGSVESRPFSFNSVATLQAR